MTQTLSIQFASAMSDDVSTHAAVDAVARELAERLTGSADMVIVFATMHHADRFALIHDRLVAALSPTAMLACTCEGVIGVRREIEKGPGLSVLAASLPGAVLEAFSYDQLDWPSVVGNPVALRETVCQTNDGRDARAIILIADPFSTPMIKLLPAFGQALPGVPVVGGMASGAAKAGQNHLMLNGDIATEGAVGLAISGDIDVQTTVSQGCRPIGRPLVITRAKRHVVQELGGRNALQVVQEMVKKLDPIDQKLVQGGGLQVGRVVNEYKGRFGPGDFLIRGLIGVDAEQGYVAIGDPQTRVGQTVQFHVRDQHSAIEDFQLMLEAQKWHGEAEGALLFSCNGRGSKLFDKPDADAGLVHHALGPIPMAGFFAAGEIGPLAGDNYVHGQTASLAVFRKPHAV